MQSKTRLERILFSRRYCCLSVYPKQNNGLWSTCSQTVIFRLLKYYQRFGCVFPYEVNQDVFTTKLSIEVAYTNRVKPAAVFLLNTPQWWSLVLKLAARIRKLVMKTPDNWQKELKAANIGE